MFTEACLYAKVGPIYFFKSNRIIFDFYGHLLFKTNKRLHTSQSTEQTDSRKCRQALAAQVAKSSLAASATTSIKKRLNIQPTNLARIQILSVCLYIPNRICETVSNFEKAILKISLPQFTFSRISRMSPFHVI